MRDVHQRTKVPANVVALPVTGQPETATAPGPVELAWIEQCSMLRKADDNPLTVAMGVPLARILDSAELAPMWPTASAKLQQLRASLEGPKKKSRGRVTNLSAVHAITR